MISKLHRIARPIRPTLHLQHISSISVKQNAELGPKSNYAPRSAEDSILEKLGAPPTFDNTRKTRIDVPGFGECPVDFELAGCQKERFAHGANDWKQNPRLTVRELSMLALICAITDKLDWNQKVFSKEIVEKWHREA